MSRVLVIWCPDWPVVACGVGGAAGDAAVAVVDRGQVLACSVAAREAGVRRRMRVRQAQHRCPQLRVVERDLGAEVRRFEPLAERLETALAPRLEVIRPGLVALPARGAARYWGGEDALADKAVAVLEEAGAQCRAGAADTLFAAVLAARAGRLVPAGETAEFLAPYPVGVLGQPRLTWLLARLGITTVGQFARLPASRVLARFGTEGAVAHRVARGVETRGLKARTAGEDRSVDMGFEPPERRLEPVVFGAKTLAERLHADLAAAGVVCARVEVRVRYADGRQRGRLWRHEGELSSLAVAERVRWQLQAWHEARAPGGTARAPGGTVGALAGTEGEDAGIAWLALVPDGLSAAVGRQGHLFGPRVTAEEMERAATRLQAMLGHGAVTRAELGAGRGPGERVRRVPFGDGPARRGVGAGPWPGRLPAPHPAGVYPNPVPATVLDVAGARIRVSGRVALSAPPATIAVETPEGPYGTVAVTGWAGPWPVLERWWDRARTRRIARLQVATADGRAWLLVIDGGRWWAEACYG